MNQPRPQMVTPAKHGKMPGRPAPPQAREEKRLVNIRRLIWLYLILLILEGSLRKWVVPRFSDPLLIVRDPVVILIYILALRARVFAWNGYVFSLLIIAVLSVLLSAFRLYDYIPPTAIALITGYGFRSNFLHLPLIFVMANVLTEEDVKKIGRWLLIGMIPMAMIMVAQFRAPAEAFINRAAGLGEGLQIQAGGGKIRPPGTFSFISGPIFYVSAATAFVLYGALTPGTYKRWLLTAAGVSVAISVAVSGSRGCVASALGVIFFIVVVLVVRPDAVNQFGRNLLIGVIATLIIIRLPIFKEGMSVLSERFISSAEAAETTIVGGMFRRTFEGFVEWTPFLSKIPLTGYGLGIGTAGGARFLVGQSTFLLTEGEWSRVLLESGPIVGLAFLLWRTVLTLRIGYLALRQLRLGRVLPVFLFSAGFFGLLNGTFGQPTSLGFAVFLTGICLAAIQNPNTPVNAPSQPPIAASGSSRVARRSDYASRMHGSSFSDQNNGVADR